MSIVVENYSSLLVENIICSGGYAYVIFNYFNESNNKVLDSSTFATGINKNNFSIDISTVYTLSIVITTQAGSGRVTNLHLF